MKIAHIEWEKKPRTLGKVQKIKDLEGVGLFHPFKNTRYEPQEHAFQAAAVLATGERRRS